MMFHVPSLISCILFVQRTSRTKSCPYHNSVVPLTTNFQIIYIQVTFKMSHKNYVTIKLTSSATTSFSCIFQTQHVTCDSVNMTPEAWLWKQPSTVDEEQERDMLKTQRQNVAHYHWLHYHRGRIDASCSNVARTKVVLCSTTVGATHQKSVWQF